MSEPEYKWEAVFCETCAVEKRIELHREGYTVDTWELVLTHIPPCSAYGCEKQSTEELKVWAIDNSQQDSLRDLDE